MLERKLGKFLLPGPLAYCASADLFVTYSSRMELEGYKYASLLQPQAGKVALADGPFFERKQCHHHAWPRPPISIRRPSRHQIGP